MIKNRIILLAAILVLSGCQTPPETIEEPVENAETAPLPEGLEITPPDNSQPSENFIFMSESNGEIEILLDNEPDYSVNVNKNQRKLTETELAPLDQWLAENTPNAVMIRGTSGKEKFKYIGDQRRDEMIKSLKGKVRVVILADYDPKVFHRGGYIWIVDEETTQLIINSTPDKVVVFSGND